MRCSTTKEKSKYPALQESIWTVTPTEKKTLIGLLKQAPDTMLPKRRSLFIPKGSVTKGVELGDWAYIFDRSLAGEDALIPPGTWVRVGDYADKHPPTEISEAAAAQIGIFFYNNSNTYATHQLKITFYPGTKHIPNQR
jgi:hypothetical protein